MSTLDPHSGNAPTSYRTTDPKTGLDVVKIFSGDWHVSKGGEMLTTILGSCVAACIRDPILRIGGMNHFLLPGNDLHSLVKSSDSARYGTYAMECLINGILREGGHKERLEIKVFGGGNVIQNSGKIGSKNAAFIRDFLKSEGYQIASEDLEGDYPRRINYYPETGKVMMKKLHRKDNSSLIRDEEDYRKRIVTKPVEGDIDLF